MTPGQPATSSDTPKLIYHIQSNISLQVQHFKRTV